MAHAGVFTVPLSTFLQRFSGYNQFLHDLSLILKSFSVIFFSSESHIASARLDQTRHTSNHQIMNISFLVNVTAKYNLIGPSTAGIIHGKLWCLWCDDFEFLRVNNFFINLPL